MDNEQTRKEIDRRKQVARSKGVMELGKLYYSKLRFFPNWIKHQDGYVASLVTSAIEEQDKESKTVTTKLTVKNKEFVFIFKRNSFYTPDGELNNHRDLELLVDGKEVLALSMAETQYDYYSEGAAFDIDAFIDGEWLKELQELEKSLTDEEQKARKNRENQELQKQKSKFGIA